MNLPCFILRMKKALQAIPAPFRAFPGGSFAVPVKAEIDELRVKSIKSHAAAIIC